MAVRGPGGRFRKPTQTEAVSGKGSEFARLIATMQLDDEFYRAELAKLEGDTRFVANSIQSNLTRGAASGAHSLSTLRGATTTVTHAMGLMNVATFALGSHLGRAGAIMSEISITALLLGRRLLTATSGVIAIGAAAVASAFNIGGFRDKILQVIDDIDSKVMGTARPSAHTQRRQLRGPQGLEKTVLDTINQAEDKLAVIQRRMSTTEAAIQEAMRGGMPERVARDLIPQQIKALEGLASAERAREQSREMRSKEGARMMEEEADRLEEEKRQLESINRLEQQRITNRRRILDLQSSRQDMITAFGIETGLWRRSQTIVDPLERALEEFRERISSGEFRTPGFTVGTERASAFAAGPGQLIIGQQSQEAKILGDQTKLMQEANNLLGAIGTALGLKPPLSIQTGRP